MSLSTCSGVVALFLFLATFSTPSSAFVLRMKKPFQFTNSDSATAPTASNPIKTITTLKTLPLKEALTKTPETWLGATGVVTEARVSDLLNALKADQQGAKLVAEAIRHAFDTTHDQFWKVMSICPGNIDPSIMGQATIGSPVRIPFERQIEESAFSIRADGSTDEAAASLFYKDKVAQFRQKIGIPPAAQQLFRFYPELVYLQTYETPPGICLRKDLTVDEAVSVLFHEMVHYISFNWKNWVEIEKYDSKQDYEYKTVLATGDEVDAYTSEWSYDIRIHGKRALPRLVQPYFNDDSTFIPVTGDGKNSKEILARLILDGPIFFGSGGYSMGRFLTEYPKALNEEVQTQNVLFKNLNLIQQERTANIPYFQQQYDLSDKNSPAGAKAKAMLAEDIASAQRLPGEILQIQNTTKLLDVLSQKYIQYECTLVKENKVKLTSENLACGQGAPLLTVAH